MIEIHRLARAAACKQSRQPDPREICHSLCDCARRPDSELAIASDDNQRFRRAPRTGCIEVGVYTPMHLDANAARSLREVKRRRLETMACTGPGAMVGIPANVATEDVRIVVERAGGTQRTNCVLGGGIEALRVLVGLLR